MKNKLCKFISTIMISTLLVSCSNTNKPVDNVESENTTNQSDSNTNEADDEELTIRFAWWGNTDRHELYTKLCRDFEKINPNIKVLEEPSSWSDYWDKLATQTAASNAPDLMGMHLQYVADYAERGTISNLDDYLGTTINTDNIPQSVIDSGYYKDNMIMIGQGITFTNFMFNTDLLDEYGITYPSNTEDWTWEEFKNTGIEFAKKADSANTGVYFAFDYGHHYATFRYWVRQRGGDLYTDAGELDYTAETVEEWFDYWAELREANVIPDIETTMETMNMPLEQSPFTLGERAVIIVPANQLTLYKNQMTDKNLALGRLPMLEGGLRGEHIEGAHYAISNTSTAEQKEAAAKLIDYISNNIDGVSLLKLEQGVPINPTLAEEIKPSLDENQQQIIDYIVETTKIARGSTVAPPGANAIDKSFIQAFERASYGQQTAKESASQFIMDANAILK